MIYLVGWWAESCVPGFRDGQKKRCLLLIPRDSVVMAEQASPPSAWHVLFPCTTYVQYCTSTWGYLGTTAEYCSLVETPLSASASSKGTYSRKDVLVSLFGCETFVRLSNTLSSRRRRPRRRPCHRRQHHSNPIQILSIDSNRVAPSNQHQKEHKKPLQYRVFFLSGYPRFQSSLSSRTSTPTPTPRILNKQTHTHTTHTECIRRFPN